MSAPENQSPPTTERPLRVVASTPEALHLRLETAEATWTIRTVGAAGAVSAMPNRSSQLAPHQAMTTQLRFAPQNSFRSSGCEFSEQIEAVMMPSRYTADISLEDARLEAEALGVDYREIPIEKPFSAFLDALSEAFAGTGRDVTEENIQARCRGVILMALSNKQGRILLTTGNKSEVSVGYATLYGDMAGGFAPIKDVPKLLVYRLAAYRNSLGRVIPQRVLERPPSAELAPDQKDQDSLPDYAVLDQVLQRYVEQDRSVQEIVADAPSLMDYLGALEDTQPGQVIELQVYRDGEAISVSLELSQRPALEFIGRGDQTRMAPAGDIDLAEAWKAMTGLPFVFAVWATRKDHPDIKDITANSSPFWPSLVSGLTTL